MDCLDKIKRAKVPAWICLICGISILWNPSISLLVIQGSLSRILIETSAISISSENPHDVWYTRNRFQSLANVQFRQIKHIAWHERAVKQVGWAGLDAGHWNVRIRFSRAVLYGHNSAKTLSIRLMVEWFEWFHQPILIRKWLSGCFEKCDVHFWFFHQLHKWRPALQILISWFTAYRPF